MSTKKTIVSIDQKFTAVMALVEKTKTKQQIMLELKIKPNTLNDWFRNKDQIVQQYNSSNRDIAAKKLFVIQAKADELAIKQGISGFSCGTSWLQRFKQRNNIVWQSFFTF